MRMSLDVAGVRYLPGGVNSGFHHVTINADTDKKLYQVKGKRNVRVRQVSGRFTDSSVANIANMAHHLSKPDNRLATTGEGA